MTVQDTGTYTAVSFGPGPHHEVRYTSGRNMYVEEMRDGRWIGAAWNHKDGKGLNIETDFVPVGDGRFVLRDFNEVRKDETKEAAGEGA